MQWPKHEQLKQLLLPQLPCTVTSRAWLHILCRPSMLLSSSRLTSFPFIVSLALKRDIVNLKKRIVSSHLPVLSPVSFQTSLAKSFSKCHSIWTNTHPSKNKTLEGMVLILGAKKVGNYTVFFNHLTKHQLLNQVFTLNSGLKM